MKDEQIAQFRAFNRFYTAVIGLLDRHYLNSGFSLTEGRILYEIYHQPEGITASALIEFLDLDKSYVSRILQRFEKKKLIAKRKFPADKRSSYLFLSAAGKREFERLNAAARQQAAQLLLPLKNAELHSLIEHMKGIRQILTNANI
jgi:DNA-binding MarR family transcriptional regulator